MGPYGTHTGFLGLWPRVFGDVTRWVGMCCFVLWVWRIWQEKKMSAMRFDTVVWRLVAVAHAIIA